VTASVAIIHGVPAFREGLCAGFTEAGLGACAVEDAADLPDRRWDVCVLQLGAADVVPIRRRWPSVRIVGMLRAPSVEQYRAALALGLEGVVAEEAEVGEIVALTLAALRGWLSLPQDVAHALAGPARPQWVDIDQRAVAWLAMVSRGESIASVAREAGYSERQMYRVMQGLYRAIGARNRAEAVALAARWGLIDELACAN
jgi:DNA-binding NarL/FixJ family response regulator